ncbi:MAG: hypothetical protein GYB67_11455 [Chloroflexi bacterium]|nr:hypothetical protein [Chloroflexota bacterium]
MWQRFVFLLVTAALIAGCDNVPPTPTPTRVLSAPTLAPSPVFRPPLTVSPPPGARGGQNDPTAAAAANEGGLPPIALGPEYSDENRQAIQVTGSDGAQISGDLYPGPNDVRGPGLLLLAVDRVGWLDLPGRLQAAGFTVMTMSIRPNAPVGDFTAMIQALGQVGAVDPGRIGVIGVENGADLALQGCAVDPICDAAVLISPLTEGALIAALPGYNPRPLFLAAARDDQASFTVASAVQASATGPLAFESLGGVARGPVLLQSNPQLQTNIIAWLSDQLTP